MKKITTLFITLFIFNSIIGQTGDTISDPIDIDGVEVSLNIADYNSATASGLIPTCSETEDIFYRHFVSVGDNKLTISLSSAAIAVLSEINFQILRAPSGDLDNLVEVTCDSYAVPLVTGGDSQSIIEDITDTDIFFLRIFKPSGIDAFLEDLINGTSISMVSEFDSSLSLANFKEDKLKIIVRNSSMELYNNNSKDFSIFGLGGEQLISKTNIQAINNIDLSNLIKGVYVLVLKDAQNSKSFKFIYH